MAPKENKHTDIGRESIYVHHLQRIILQNLQVLNLHTGFPLNIAPLGFLLKSLVNERSVGPKYSSVFSILVPRVGKFRSTKHSPMPRKSSYIWEVASISDGAVFELTHCHSSYRHCVHKIRLGLFSSFTSLDQRCHA